MTMIRENGVEEQPGLRPLVRTAWDVIEEACINRVSGEMTLTTDNGPTRVYLNAGLVYFAEHAGDESLGARLLEAGAVDTTQLQRGAVRLNGVEHLGRMFDRDPSIDRDVVELTVEMITEQTLTEIAEQPVASHRTTLYRHHPSGISRWFSSQPTPPSGSSTPAPVDTAPVDAVPVDAVPVDAAPLDAVPVVPVVRESVEPESVEAGPAPERESIDEAGPLDESVEAEEDSNGASEAPQGRVVYWPVHAEAGAEADEVDHDLTASVGDTPLADAVELELGSDSDQPEATVDDIDVVDPSTPDALVESVPIAADLPASKTAFQIGSEAADEVADDDAIVTESDEELTAELAEELAVDDAPMPTLPSANERPAMRIETRPLGDRPIPSVSSNARPEVVVAPGGPRLPGMGVDPEPEPAFVDRSVEPADDDPAPPIAAAPVRGPMISPADDLIALATAIAAGATVSPAIAPVVAPAVSPAGGSRLHEMQRAAPAPSVGASFTSLGGTPATDTVDPIDLLASLTPLYSDRRAPAESPLTTFAPMTELVGANADSLEPGLSDTAPTDTKSAEDEHGDVEHRVPELADIDHTGIELAHADPSDFAVADDPPSLVGIPSDAGSRVNGSPAPAAASADTPFFQFVAEPASITEPSAASTIEGLSRRSDPTAPPQPVEDFGSIPVPADVAAAVRRAISAIEAATHAPSSRNGFAGASPDRPAPAQPQISFGPMHVTTNGLTTPFSIGADELRIVAEPSVASNPVTAPTSITPATPAPRLSPMDAFAAYDRANLEPADAASASRPDPMNGLTILEPIETLDPPHQVHENPQARPISSERRGALRRLIDGIRRRS